jgi:hypothetical protein
VESGNRAWLAYDVSSIFGTAGGAFVGAAFDGRYLFLAPNQGGVVVRYDTTTPITEGSAWASFNAATLPTPAQGFSGAVFDGRYVNFVPGNGVTARVDTTLPNGFATGTAWSSLNLEALSPPTGPGLTGYHGGTFDGRYAYLAPYGAAGTYSGRVLRYDTTTVTADAGGPEAGADAAPDAAATLTADGWSIFDTSAQNASAIGFVGAIFDGRYMYLAPYFNRGKDNAGYSGVVARYDTQGSFAGFGSWSYFDVSTMPSNSELYGFHGAVYDGHYVYFVPSRGTAVVRYDTGGAFNQSSSWSAYELATLIGPDASVDDTSHFSTGMFDGRYVYFVPAFNKFGVVVRYDTASPFGLPCAWSAYDLTSINALAYNFMSAAYDGRYLYLIPFGSSILMRFETKNTTSMPALPEFNGSFY